MTKDPADGPACGDLRRWSAGHTVQSWRSPRRQMRANLASRIFFLVVPTCALACGPEPAGSHALAAVQGTTELVAASHSGLREARRSVITDEPGWTSLWATIYADVTPAPPRPAVDLARQVVIVVALGQRPTGGYAIHIDSVRSGAGGREVFVTTTAPAPTCMTTQEFTQPVHVVAAPLAAGSTRFLESEKTEECAG